MVLKISVGSEHAGNDYRIKLAKWLREAGHLVCEIHENNIISEYPEVAEKVALEVVEEKSDLGILICGTGIGMCMAASKIPGARVALCSDSYMGRMAKEHNNANILTFGSRVIGFENMLDIISTFINAEFTYGRHEMRLKKLQMLENKYLKGGLTK